MNENVETFLKTNEIFEIKQWNTNVACFSFMNFKAMKTGLQKVFFFILQGLTVPIIHYLE